MTVTLTPHTATLLHEQAQRAGTTDEEFADHLLGNALLERTAQLTPAITVSANNGSGNSPVLESTEERKQRIIRANAPSIALLKSWLAEAPTDPDEIAEAEADLEEFKRNINRWRREAGAPLVYPEAD